MSLVDTFREVSNYLLGSYKPRVLRDSSTGTEIQVVSVCDSTGALVPSFGGVVWGTIAASAITEGTVSLTDTSITPCIAAGTVTVGGFIQNIGANPCWLRTKTVAVAGSGAYLGLYQSLRFDEIIPGKLYTGDVYGICASTKTTTLWVSKA